jgi:hypothetical protein
MFLPRCADVTYICATHYINHMQDNVQNNTPMMYPCTLRVRAPPVEYHRHRHPEWTREQKSSSSLGMDRRILYNSVCSAVLCTFQMYSANPSDLFLTAVKAMNTGKQPQAEWQCQQCQYISYNTGLHRTRDAVYKRIPISQLNIHVAN